MILWRANSCTALRLKLHSQRAAMAHLRSARCARPAMTFRDNGPTMTCPRPKPLRPLADLDPRTVHPLSILRTRTARRLPSSPRAQPHAHSPAAFGPPAFGPSALSMRFAVRDPPALYGRSIIGPALLQTRPRGHSPDIIPYILLVCPISSRRSSGGLPAPDLCYIFRFSRNTFSDIRLL